MQQTRHMRSEINNNNLYDNCEARFPGMNPLCTARTLIDNKEDESKFISDLADVLMREGKVSPKDAYKIAEQDYHNAMK